MAHEWGPKLMLMITFFGKKGEQRPYFCCATAFQSNDSMHLRESHISEVCYFISR